jgi:hypothetical protein
MLSSLNQDDDVLLHIPLSPLLQTGVRYLATCVRRMMGGVLDTLRQPTASAGRSRLLA